MEFPFYHSLPARFRRSICLSLLLLALTGVLPGKGEMLAAEAGAELVIDMPQSVSAGQIVHIRVTQLPAGTIPQQLCISMMRNTRNSFDGLADLLGRLDKNGKLVSRINAHALNGRHLVTLYNCASNIGLKVIVVKVRSSFTIDLVVKPFVIHHQQPFSITAIGFPPKSNTTNLCLFVTGVPLGKLHRIAVLPPSLTLSAAAGSKLLGLYLLDLAPCAQPEHSLTQEGFEVIQ